MQADVKAFERLQIVRDPKSFVLGFEVEVMCSPGQVFWSLQPALYECLIDN